MRPFVEARAGIETYARVGFDLTIGSLLERELLVRDPVSGHRYRVIRENETGFALSLAQTSPMSQTVRYCPKTKA